MAFYDCVKNPKVSTVLARVLVWMAGDIALYMDQGRLEMS